MRISLVLLLAILSTITVSPSSARPSSVRRLGPASWSGLVWCYWALARPPQVQDNIFMNRYILTDCSVRTATWWARVAACVSAVRARCAAARATCTGCAGRGWRAAGTTRAQSRGTSRT